MELWQNTVLPTKNSSSAIPPSSSTNKTSAAKLSNNFPLPTDKPRSIQVIGLKN